MATTATKQRAPLSSADIQTEINQTSKAIAELKAARPELAAAKRFEELDANSATIASLDGRLEALQQAKDTAARREAEDQATRAARQRDELIAMKDARVTAYRAALAKAHEHLSQETVNEVMRCYREASAICSDVVGLTQDWHHHAMSLGIPANKLGPGAQRFLILAPKTRADSTAWAHLLPRGVS